MQNKKQKKLSLSDYAKLAKKRMASGVWDKIRREREEYIKNSNESAEKINRIYSKRLMREFYGFSTDNDEELYHKVCHILESDSFVTNPITQLIDHAEYDKLDFPEQQAYLIKLADKYKELRERYDREKVCRMRISM